MKHIFSLLLLLFISQIAISQKKEIDHRAYNEWKKLEAHCISNDGNFVSYTIKPLRGDGYLYIYNQVINKLDSIPRGYNQQFSGNSNFLVFKITPGFDTLRNCELNKIDKEKWPKDSLGIYLLEKDSLIKISKLKSFTLPEEGDWLSYTSEYNSLVEEIGNPKDSVEEKPITPIVVEIPKKSKFTFFKKKKEVEVVPVEKVEEKPVAKEEKYKSDGKLFTSLNAITGEKQQYIDVTEFVVSKKGKYVALISHKKEKKIGTYQLAILEPTSGDYSVEATRKGFSNCTFNHSEKALALLSTEDTTENKQFELTYLELKSKKFITLIDTSTASIPAEKSISDNRSPVFSENDELLFFGIAKRVEQKQKDTLLVTEKAVVDVWNYQDKRLQPQQKVELKDDLKKTDLYVLQLEDKKIIALSNDTLTITLPAKKRGNYLLATSKEMYQGTYNWSSPNLEDHYRVSIADGKVESLKKGVGFGGNLSPSGKWYTYFNGEEGEHYLQNVSTKKEICLTCERKDVKWVVDLNGQPQKAEPYGIVGWIKNENEIMIQSEYDVWNYSITAGKIYSITNEEGKNTKTRLKPSFWDHDSLYLEYNNMYIRGFNEKTNGNVIYEITAKPQGIELKKMYAMEAELVDIARSKNTEKIILRRSTVAQYPDLHFLDKNYTNEIQISKTNPQQQEYNWASVETVEWTSYDGIPLKGLVYTPENFDSEKSYPMIVYYYELYSEDIHKHYAPRPSASVINPIEFASAGYVVFFPDIRYREGHPAKSAYDCIMSGTDKVLKLYPNIDSKHMGLQGQSWGGYQTAQMITMTNRYAAAMAGAPVSDMISAYGGIRWGSGLNRQFQYERQQSRIGQTLWDAPELYIENSPIFHLPNITTPLLIMSNDSDGAVPWYQGIEMFTGMKRLGKPVWLLNYNGDDHNLTKMANRIDYSIRLRQFFDYYLLEKPAPKWLIDGIPMVVKGDEYRLELIEK